jgi:hypothetical protein
MTTIDNSPGEQNGKEREDNFPQQEQNGDQQDVSYSDEYDNYCPWDL